jgi:hypothetical protein
VGCDRMDGGAFHRVEEQLVFKAVGQGIVTTSHRMGTDLSRVERWLGRSWSWIAVMVVILAAIWPASAR